MKKNKNSFGISVGSSSILVVFVVLCLTTFATLSLVSANADYNLSAKTADATKNYYAADCEAEEKLQAVDAVLKEVYQGFGTDEAAYRTQLQQDLRLSHDCTLLLNDNGGALVEYEIPAGGERVLFVQLDISDHYLKTDGTIKPVCWQIVIPSEEDQFDDLGNLPIFTTDGLPG